MIGHAIFDLDGTLVDSVPHMADLLNAMLAERGEAMRVTGEAVRAHTAGGGLAMIEALLGARCGEPAKALSEFRERYAAAPTPPDSLYPGVRDGLKALAGGGVVLALVSNKSQRLCDKILDDLAIAPLFAAIVGTSPAIPEKPDPAGFDAALTACGGTRLKSCYVGDSRTDHALAKAAGVPLVLAAWGYGAAAVRGPGVRVARDFADIPGQVRSALAAAPALIR